MQCERLFLFFYLYSCGKLTSLPLTRTSSPQTLSSPDHQKSVLLNGIPRFPSLSHLASLESQVWFLNLLPVDLLVDSLFLLPVKT